MLQEFVRIVVNFIETSIKDDSEIIFYSVGCTDQNRNSIMSNALALLVKQKDITVTQKFLEKGHTRMECDSMNAITENRLRNRQICTPAGYVEAFDKLALYSFIRLRSRSGDPTVTDMRCLKYDLSGVIQDKLKFSDTWQTLPRGMSNIYNSFEFPALYNSRLKIKAEKYAYLQQLKEVIPKDHHSFYDNLPVYNKRN
ncbi:hypothetical protein ANN_09431 [Periplaneta americana]|uniref:Uncharacterized protein n=1 Tax=Periplaneta americana TaxID=6978 RepID=A0ABQ8TP92_PERAM|nr:hypothetical protein ANN_09431 [Periplaneta americana]